MAKTPANTGQSISRNGNSFTAKWTIKTKDVDWQKVRYRTYNGKWGGWTTKKVGKKATSYTFDLSASGTFTNVEVQTQIKRKKKTASAWTSAKFPLAAPAAPTLTVTNDSSNKTTFTWSSNHSATGGGMYQCCYYRTKCDANPDSDSGWGNWTEATQGTYTYTDNVQGQTRVFQIKARGPAGESAIITERHVLGAPPRATWTNKPVSYTDKGSYYEMTASANLTGSTYAIDSVVPQYYIGTPDASINVPGGSNWSDGTTFNYDGSKAYDLTINTNDIIGPDECLWVQIKTIHDSIESFSDTYRVITGRLTAPELSLNVSTPTASGFTVGVTVDNHGTSLPGAYMEMYLEKYSATGVENYILIGTIPNGTSTITITCTEDITGETGYALHTRNVSSDGVTMTSDYDSYSTTMPVAPTLDSVTPTSVAGKVYLSWTNSWSDATGVIIAWTDDQDNWMSNDDPEEYEVKELASNWFITGLETGKKWWFRIRSVKEENDSQTLSPWSSDLGIDLASAPAVPVLYLSAETITEDGMVTAYWSHVSTDGTGQIASDIVEATYSGGVWTYGNPVVATKEAQHVDIYAAVQGWTNGTTKYLALRTRSGSGGMSDYSTPVKLVVAAKPTVNITANSFSGTDSATEYFLGDGATDTFQCANSMTVTPTVTVNGTAATVVSYTNGAVELSAAPADGADVVITYTTGDNKVLTGMPLTATITTTNSVELTVAIERAVTYPMLRPDGTLTDGAEGETIYVNTIAAESTNSISIQIDDILGRLDDGAWYNLIATVHDAYDQTAEKLIRFKVHWSHQSWAPTASFVTDPDNFIARITPIAGADYVSGDTCDIYRLSADQPELIVTGGTFGTEYVDPYPAFGPESGYKVVTVTATKDYITEDSTFGEYDTTDDPNTSYDQLDPGLLVIDFDADRIELEYNISLGNSWAKDFQRTAYLGGHVTGDHNRAVTRDTSASSLVVRGDDEEIAFKVRQLARYTGLCHVRTPEGSSFVADVQVSESQAYNSPTVDYDLSIQKVDPVGFDGMTYAEWDEIYNEESS